MLDPSVFLLLNDSILDLIAVDRSTPGLASAQALLERFEQKDMYTVAVDQELCPTKNTADEKVWNMKEIEIQQSMLLLANCFDYTRDAPLLLESDFVVQKNNLHCGAKAENPLSKVRFFHEVTPEFGQSAPDHLPLAYSLQSFDTKESRSFQELRLRIIVRTSSKQKLVEAVFDAWYKSLRGRRSPQKMICDVVQ